MTEDLENSLFGDSNLRACVPLPVHKVSRL